MIDSLSVDYPLTHGIYCITVDYRDANDEMVTEDEEGDDESSSTPTVLTKDAVVAFETALNFLQQG